MSVPAPVHGPELIAGDEIRVHVPAAALLRGALIGYGLPLVGMLAGAFVLGGREHDAFGAAGALLGLLLGVLLGRLVQRTLGRRLAVEFVFERER